MSEFFFFNELYFREKVCGIPFGKNYTEFEELFDGKGYEVHRADDVWKQFNSEYLEAAVGMWIVSAADYRSILRIIGLLQHPEGTPYIGSSSVKRECMLKRKGIIWVKSLEWRMTCENRTIRELALVEFSTKEKEGS